ncbi:uroporphyrinogen-III synthase [Aquicella lusitana]|uniref:Uroporphyrinogen-III synthase n=1 Tax=Aquicella lusitana TaxID=254246 RepID=A0A370G578_9COXI|nr:uroporphyrinogen-III synthase [Aquicella lusitana]RDI38370.1 uroporphyrinogen-III synthase [Aquicella lusitana]VVC72383.1 Uroporphyrinogen-III synthase [Aquicella lusitana]
MNDSACLTILVTRPDPAGSMLCALIKAEGDQAVHLPAMRFEPLVDQPDFQSALDHLGEQDWVLFVSPQAVYASIAAIRKKWPVLPPQLKFAAVGEGTAKALKEAGYLMAVHPQGEWNSESVLELPAFRSVAGQKIAIIQGEGGRERLPKALADRGATITQLIAYQRQLPNVEMAPFIKLLNQRGLDAVICTSFEGVQNIKKLFTDASWPILRSTPLIVVSERIKTLAHALGFQTIWVARNASHPAILECLVQKRKEIWQIKQTK